MLFAIGFYDYVTFLTLIFIVAGFLAVALFFLALPGKIARGRNHPEVDAVNLMGWLGFLGGVPWIQALIWAIKEVDTIDVRRFPEEEREALRQQAEKYKAQTANKDKDDKGAADDKTP